MVGMGLLQPLSLTRFRRNQYLPRVYGPEIVPLAFSSSSGEFGVSESLNQQIDRLEEIYKSELDPQGRAFVPLADAHRRLGDLGKALALIEEGLGTHPDFASAHMVAGWVHRSREEPDDAKRSFERVLALDAENLLARAAIAELIDDQRAQTYRDKMAAKETDEPAAGVMAEAGRPVVPISSLAPGAPDEDARPVVSIASLAPGVADVDARPVVSIASLAPGVADVDARSVIPIASLAPGVADLDARPVVPIASLAPEAAAVPAEDSLPVVPIPSLAPDLAEDASDEAVAAGGEIYTRTLAELYAGQGATEKAIEVYRKLIEYDPDNEVLVSRMTELETLEPGTERQTVPIESLAPDGTSGVTRFLR